MATVERLIRELERLNPGFGLRVTPSAAWIRCPNPDHKQGNERTPSLRINFNANQAPIGAFNCFGCSYSGSWNDLARKVKVSRFSSIYERDVVDLPHEVDEELLGESEPSEMIGGMLWPKQTEWRGIPGKLINAIGGRHYFDHAIQLPRLYLPVEVQERHVGGIRCLLEPDPNKQILKYQNTPGRWVKKNLFPYDYVAAMEPTFVVLCEGPRDALNLLAHKVPALCNLGSANSWSEDKISLLLDLDLSLVALGFDPDDAGKEATQKIKDDLHSWIPTKRLKLPEDTDPGKLNRRQIRRLRRTLDSKVR